MIYVGVDGKAREVKAIYVGVPNKDTGEYVAREVSVLYASENGIAKTGWSAAVEEFFVFSGEEQIYIVPKNGTYTIEATGAGGSKGNTYTADYSSVPGKGGKITGTFALNKGDVLHIVVGGVGTGTKGTAKDGASGGAGGGTFIFREIPAITDSRYQFAKGNLYLEALLVAPGGGGAWDESYKGSRGDGKDGLAAAYKNPSNYVAWSTESGSPTATTTSKTNTMGITQYINYDAQGTIYTRNSSASTGGFGCGGSSDDNQTAGGGWSGSNTTGSYGWSLDTNAVGEDGVESGNGSAHIKRIGA